VKIPTGDLAAGSAHTPWYRLLGRDRAPLRPATREAIWGYFFVSPWIIGMLAFTLGPMIAGVVLGFFMSDMVTPAYWVGLKWYQSLFIDTLYLRSLLNTAY
jgi:multiple sugar transport system permease protein